MRDEISFDNLILCVKEFSLIKIMSINANQTKWDSVKRYKLTKMLNELSNFAGHGTESVTVYIPPRRPIFDVISQVA